MKIPLYTPEPETSLLREEVDQAIARVIDHGQFIMGPEVERFEERVVDYLGVEHAVGLGSGTDALVIALDALEIGEGDEVITTPMSFFATAESISRMGAKPVFVDINPESYNIDVGKIEEKITDRTAAILPVHLYGRPVEMDVILELVSKYDLKVIEDCAQSFGAEFGGQKTGTIGDVGTFSFFPTKNLGGMGDGGMLVTDNDEIAEKTRMLRVHGAKDKYYNEELGYNSRLDTIQAAVLDVKLDYIDEFNRRRRKAAEFYDSCLEKVKGTEVPDITDGAIFHQYTIRVSGGKRDKLKAYLENQGISTKVYFPVPQNELPVYDEKEYPVLPEAHRMSQDVLSLPIWPHIREKKLEYVTGAISAYFQSI